MNCKPRLSMVIVVAAISLGSAGALAQAGATAKLYCHAVGASPPEALGDREGHAIAVGQITCRVEGGVTDGGVLTGMTIYEWDKGSATMLSGSGVTRKPGATTAYQHTEGKQSLILTDGKVTGAAGSGRGRYTMATGAAAVNDGKTYSYTFRTNGPGQFIVEVKND
jgi:hypothetical protein